MKNTACKFASNSALRDKSPRIASALLWRTSKCATFAESLCGNFSSQILELLCASNIYHIIIASKIKSTRHSERSKVSTQSEVDFSVGYRLPQNDGASSLTKTKQKENLNESYRKTHQGTLPQWSGV